MSRPDYHCPMCGTLSEMVIGETQAFCTNKTGCPVISFDPSLPDGGMSNTHFIELPEDPKP